MDRRDEILTAAQHAFLKYGIEKITLDDIAGECGIKKTAIYYYFKSKEDIVAEMLKQQINAIQLSVSEKVDQSKTVREKLHSFMKTKIIVMQDNLPLMKLLQNEYLPNKVKQILLEKSQDMRDFDFHLVREIIKQGIQNHKVSCELNDSLVLMILGVTYRTFFGRFMENANWDTDEMIDTAIEVIFNGIG
ncbi:MAG TPA: TetR/AcrR family transcriptional regulator [Candidatus Cloacimonadota bacterium]|nr:TetR/AcrR family transcriptional regulator [Candidatus Cloacimonadota bacterium]